MTTKQGLKILAVFFAVLLIAAGLCSCAFGNLSYEDEEAAINEFRDYTAEHENGSYHLISFPGLGIQNLKINRVLFKIGSVTVYWYGVIITLGIVAAVSYAWFMFKEKGLKTDDLIDITIWAVVCGVVGARLYYVLMKLDSYTDFWSIFKIWEGGIAIYGALIGGGLAVFLVCLKKKIPFFKVGDAAMPGIMLAQAMGRWGNFTNGEAYGYLVEEGSPLYFIRMGIYPHPDVATDALNHIAYVHPTFLYESLWNLIGFILINVIFCFTKRKKYDGQTFFACIAWYGFGRTFIELLRTDSLYLFGAVRVSSLVGIICFLVGTAMFIYVTIKGRKAALATESYESSFPLFDKSKKETAEEPETTVETTERSEEPENNEKEKDE